MLNVLNVIHYPVYGGPHNQAAVLSEPLLARGFRTMVVLPLGSDASAERLGAAGIEVHQIPLHRLRATRDPRAMAGLLWGLPPELWRLHRLIRDLEIDIVQIGGLVNPHGALAAASRRRPVVWQLLDTRAPAPVRWTSMLFVRALASSVMVTGWRVGQAHEGWSKLASRAVSYYPPVDLERFRPRPQDRDKVRLEWALSPERFVVGSIANINPQKGIDDLVDAFARLHLTRPNTSLVLVGAEYDTHSPYSRLLRRRIARHGLIEGADVVFVGQRDDVERQLQGFDVFALASVARSEGVPTAMLEAMATEVPVVVTDVGGVTEAVTDGIDGLVVPPSDADRMARALACLVDSESSRRWFAAAGFERATRDFGVDACADAHVKAYRLALGKA